MASNQSNWLWDADVFGPQAPQSNPAPTPGVYPECGRQQERNWALENMLYGLENVIAPDITTIKNNSNTIAADTSSLLSTTQYIFGFLSYQYAQGQITNCTDKLTLAAGSNSLPTTKLNVLLTNIDNTGQIGRTIKVSLYNPAANNSMTVFDNSAEGFLLEPSVSLDLDLAGNNAGFIANYDNPSQVSVTGTTGETVYIVYSVLIQPI